MGSQKGISIAPSLSYLETRYNFRLFVAWRSKGPGESPTWASSHLLDLNHPTHSPARNCSRTRSRRSPI